MGKPSRDKGARAEREVAAIFTAAGLRCFRTPNSGGLRIPGDIEFVVEKGGATHRVAETPALHVEVKRQERLDVPAWLRQLAAEAPKGSLAILAFRRSRDEWQAIIPLKDLAQLLAREDT